MITRARRATVLGTTFLAIAVVVTACTGGGAAPEPIGATCEEFGTTPNVVETAELAVGDELTIVLCANASTGFSWEEPVVSDGTVVEVVGSAYVDPSTDEPMVGAFGEQEITVEALAAGTSTVTVAYSRPWEGGEKGVWTYEVTVTVR